MYPSRTVQFLPMPEFVHGVSLNPILQTPQASGHVAVSYFKKTQTVRDSTHRLIVHQDGHRELYDQTSDAPSTKNIAGEQPKMVERLSKLLDERMNLD